MMKSTQRIAIDVGTAEIKITFLAQSKANFIIRKLISVDTRDVEKDKLGEKIKQSLQASFSKEELSNSAFSLILSYPFVEVKRMELPLMPRDEIRKAIIWQAKDKIALDIDKSFFDFVITEEISEEYGSKKLVVMVVISQKTIINDFAKIFKELGLEVIGINVCPFSFSNILNAHKIAQKEALSVVEIGYEHTYISLYKEGGLVFLRVIPIAANQITNAMVGKYLKESGEEVELTYDKAEALKKKYGISVDTEEELLEGIPRKQLLARMRPVLERLSTETKRSFDYYVSELGGMAPKKVYLAGGGSQIKNLDTFLKEAIQLEVEPLRLPEEIKNESGQEALPYLGAISQALQMEAKPNLLPVEFMELKLRRAEKISIRMVAFTAFSVLLLAYLILTLRVSDYKNRLISTKSHRDVMQTLVDTYNKVSAREDLCKEISAGAISYITLFKEISNIIPDDCMLETLSINEDTKMLILNGILFQTAKTAEEVLASFTEEIEASSSFEEATLKKIIRSGSEVKNVSTFEIECKIK